MGSTAQQHSGGEVLVTHPRVGRVLTAVLIRPLSPSDCCPRQTAVLVSLSSAPHDLESSEGTSGEEKASVRLASRQT